MKVSEWFSGFVDRHVKRHPRADWPSPADAPEFFAGWQGNFVLHGVTEDVADEASTQLMADPPRFLGEHVPALLNEARKLFRERAESGQGQATDSREAAILASRDCPDCGGHGLTTRFRHKSASDGKGPSIKLYCLCPSGRWLENNHARHAPDVRRRMYDLAEHPWLQLRPVPWSSAPDNAFRYPPDEWDGYADRPIGTPYAERRAEPPPRPFAGIRGVRHLAAAMPEPPRPTPAPRPVPAHTDDDAPF